MGLLENTIGAMLGGQHGGGGQSFGGGSPYAPLATALIGLLAAKAMSGGFGNLGGILGGAGPGASSPSPGGSGTRQGGLPPQAAAGGGLLAGLGALLHQFQQNGQGSLAQSWVGTGPNQPATPAQIEQALGPETLQDLGRQNGMSAQEVAAQLSQALPGLIDRLTPHGRLPNGSELPAGR